MAIADSIESLYIIFCSLNSALLERTYVYTVIYHRYDDIFFGFIESEMNRRRDQRLSGMISYIRHYFLI